MRVVERVLELEVRQRIALGCSDYLAAELPFFQAGRYQVFCQQQQRTCAAWLIKLNQGIVDIRMDIQRLVGGQRPGRGGPDDDCAIVDLRQPESMRQFGFVTELESDVNRSEERRVG